jgi:hypothetical protein
VAVQQQGVVQHEKVADQVVVMQEGTQPHPRLKDPEQDLLHHHR